MGLQPVFLAFPRFTKKSLCTDLPKVWATILPLWFSQSTTYEALPAGTSLHLPAWTCSAVLQRKAEERRQESEQKFICRHGSAMGEVRPLASQVSHGFPSQRRGSSATGVASGQLLFTIPEVLLTCLKLLPQCSGQPHMTSVGLHHHSALR